MSDKPGEKEVPPSGELKEDVDYYFDNGLMVLTAGYLLKRGYCCRNGCRHCPYPQLAEN